MQIIHGDYNERNIIMQLSDNGKDYKVVGVIDFDDINKSPFEVGVGGNKMFTFNKKFKFFYFIFTWPS